MQSNSSLYSIQSINCVFNRFQQVEVRQRIHEHVDRLVKTWKSKIPVVIIESEARDLSNIVSLAGFPFFFFLFVAFRNLIIVGKRFNTKSGAMKHYKKLFRSTARWLVMDDLQDFEVTNPFRANNMSNNNNLIDDEEIRGSSSSGSSGGSGVVVQNESEFSFPWSQENRVLFFSGSHFDASVIPADWRTFVATTP